MTKKPQKAMTTLTRTRVLANIEAQRVAGMYCLANDGLTVAGIAEHRKRSWRERLFSRPWTPLIPYEVVTAKRLPDPYLYIVDSLLLGKRTIVAHPETIWELMNTPTHEQSEFLHQRQVVLP